MRPKEFQAKTTYGARMERKANDNPLIFAQVGDGGGVVATGRANFYWVRLVGDGNRLTQCYSLIPLANNDLIFVRRAKDRKLTYYEFAEFIQDGAGGTAPPIQDHDHSGAGEGGQLDWDDIWTDAVHDHSAAGEGGQLDWDSIWTDAVHSHANAAEGGQLDWDSIWTDAVHDHSSNAEGGQDLRQIQELEFDDVVNLTIVAGVVTRIVRIPDPMSRGLRLEGARSRASRCSRTRLRGRPVAEPPRAARRRRKISPRQPEARTLFITSWLLQNSFATASCGLSAPF